jgi:hypothetical protein
MIEQTPPLHHGKGEEMRVQCIVDDSSGTAHFSHREKFSRSPASEVRLIGEKGSPNGYTHPPGRQQSPENSALYYVKPEASCHFVAPVD